MPSYGRAQIFGDCEIGQIPKCALERNSIQNRKHYLFSCGSYNFRANFSLVWQIRWSGDDLSRPRRKVLHAASMKHIDPAICVQVNGRWLNNSYNPVRQTHCRISEKVCAAVKELGAMGRAISSAVKSDLEILSTTIGW